MTDLARQLNAFAADLKAKRRGEQPQPKAVRETAPEYLSDWLVEAPTPLFTEDELQWLQTINI
ncbi:MAG: hypothetical protein FJ014_10000 [Chloroflexi bacterium]|nr:hypothetical protein [Chloroflexota bacterium]